MATVVASVKGIEKLNKADLIALKKAADSLGVPVDWLATVISFETAGTFSPSIQNPHSRATGLIQFLPVTASNLLKIPDKDKAIAKTKAMSFSEQLTKMVLPYFKPYKSRIKSLDDLYLAVFYPAAIGKPSDWVVGEVGSKTYEQNAGFDRTQKGYITQADITSSIRSVLARAADLAPTVIPGASLIAMLFFTGLASVGGYQVFEAWKKLKDGM